MPTAPKTPENMNEHERAAFEQVWAHGVEEGMEPACDTEPDAS